MTPEKPKPKRSHPGAGRPKGSLKKRLDPVLPVMAAQEPVMGASVAMPMGSFHPPWVTEEPEPKARRLVSALDNRKDWRRTDGTLYSYFRVTGSSFTRVADRVADSITDAVSDAVANRGADIVTDGRTDRSFNE